jgi:hypothetical protein
LDALEGDVDVPTAGGSFEGANRAAQGGGEDCGFELRNQVRGESNIFFDGLKKSPASKCNDRVRGVKYG